VRARGIEPNFDVFSVLLIDAFLCELRHNSYQIIANKIKHNFAIVGNFEKIYLCDFVLDRQCCAVTVR
jgi:hypothetical protein